MVYEYSWSGLKRAVPAETVAVHLQKMEAEKGRVTREDFLESARPEGSEMHSLFEWDDTVAAEKYRLVQAGDIIHSITLTVVSEDSAPTVTRAFVAPGYSTKKIGDSPGYISIRRAVNEPDLADKMMSDARRSAQWFHDKYGTISQLETVMAAIEDFLEKTA